MLKPKHSLQPPSSWSFQSRWWLSNPWLTTLLNRVILSSFRVEFKVSNLQLRVFSLHSWSLFEEQCHSNSGGTKYPHQMPEIDVFVLQLSDADLYKRVRLGGIDIVQRDSLHTLWVQTGVMTAGETQTGELGNRFDSQTVTLSLVFLILMTLS